MSRQVDRATTNDDGARRAKVPALTVGTWPKAGRRIVQVARRFLL